MTQSSSLFINKPEKNTTHYYFKEISGLLYTLTVCDLTDVYVQYHAFMNTVKRSTQSTRNVCKKKSDHYLNILGIHVF